MTATTTWHCMKEEKEDDDGEIGAAAVPIMLLEMAEQLFEAGDSASLGKAIAALEKAQTILFHLHPEEKIMLDKARAKMVAGEMQVKCRQGVAK